MTAFQRNNISTPAAGLMVWCNDCGSKGEIQIYDGTAWVNLIGGSRQLTAATTKIGVDIDGEAAYNQSGNSVAISSDGTTVAIGAANNYANGNDAGHVRVYQNIAGTWTQIGADIDGEAANDQSGTSVAISSDGTTVAIGAKLNDGVGTNAGQVRVYKNITGTWTKIGADIDGEAAYDNFGYSVAISSDGSTVAIGAPYNDGSKNNAGHVRVYQNIAGTWTKIGVDIDGILAYGLFGVSVSISSDGTTVAIGGNNLTRVFKNIAGTWIKVGADMDIEIDDDYSVKSSSVSISSDGTILAIGSAYNDGGGIDAGQVRVYNNIAGTWTKIGSGINGEAAGDNSGWSVSISSDGTAVAIGAPNNDGIGSNAGQVRVYHNILGTWTKIVADIDGEAADDNSGTSVAIASDCKTVAIGAIWNVGAGINAGHVRVYKIGGL
jgi:Flp pilus assembly pilin Flp